MNDEPRLLPVVRAAALEEAAPEARWLARDLWLREAVGIIGGAPKSCKSWLGLDLAVSVASKTPCLGRFPIEHPGPALVYLAEDALPALRARIDSLCLHRGLSLAALDVHAITAPTLRLDLPRDQQRLLATVESLRPRLLLLDPLVRLHRLDENNATEISGLLGFLRELQRRFAVAVVLAHHASKKRRAQPGQALRGSSDLHAWTDSSAFLARRDDQLLLTLEHRAAAAPEPMTLKLVSRSDGSATHLEVVNAPEQANPHALADGVLDQLRRGAPPLTRAALRSALRVNNQRLGDALRDLERRGLVRRTASGWTRAA